MSDYGQWRDDRSEEQNLNEGRFTESWRTMAAEKKMKEEAPEFRLPTVNEILNDHDNFSDPIKSWRGIRADTMKKFGVRMQFSSKTREPEKVFFPVKSKSTGQVIGYQQKNLAEPKESPFHFINIGIVKSSNGMFMQQDVPRGIKGSKVKLWICEGWVDALSAWQVLRDLSLKKGFDFNPSVVSIVGGSTNAKSSVAANIDFIRTFTEKINVCFDNDERGEFDPKSVVRGREATEAVCAMLDSDNVYKPVFPEGKKDLNDFIKDGGNPKQLVDLLFNTEKFQAQKIVRFSDIMTFEESLAPVPEGVYVNCFPKLMERLRGFRDHELTVYTALTSVGKSSFVTEIVYNCMMAGRKAALIYLEDPVMKLQKRLAARYLEVHPNRYKFDPRNCGKTEEELRGAWDFTNNINSVSVLDHFGSIPVRQLMNKVKALYAGGARDIVIDHISLMVAGEESTDERKDLDVAMQELASFRAANPCHIHVVCHLNGQAESNGNERPKEPRWQYVFTKHLRGSRGLGQMACNIIGLHNEETPDGTRGRVMLGLLKNREAESIGDCDIVRMDKMTGLWYDASEELWVPAGGPVGY